MTASSNRFEAEVFIFSECRDWPQGGVLDRLFSAISIVIFYF